MLRFAGVALVLSVAWTGHSGASAGESAQHCGNEPKPCIAYGAHVFQGSCALCHGTDGLGEGILSLAIKNYPDTNLTTPRHATDRGSLEKVITYGGTLPEVSHYMPPWGDELTVTQRDSVVLFVELLRENLEASLALLRHEAQQIAPSRRIGRAIYKGRCVLCHGDGGEGDGKMVRIIKDPPPFNLTLSRLPDDYLEEFISRGGGAMGRSARMPPFGGDLTENEIRSVIMHLKTLRE